MNCPVCKTVTLVPEELESDLASKACPQCHGRWIEGERYLAWAARHAHKLTHEPVDAPADVQPAVADSPKAKLCPDCGRFLTRAKVGKGTPFSIDRCATCGGIWTDANEWESLKSRNLHQDLHFIFSAAWQADVHRDERKQMHEQRLLRNLGADDLAEIRRIRAWLDAHPKRAELYAILIDGVDIRIPKPPTPVSK